MKMTDKDLIKQLNSLKSVKADAAWVEDSKETLKLQVYNGQKSGNIGFFAKFNIITSRLFQPAGVAVLIMLFFVASGIFGLSASSQARPGDTLYIAKVISEKAQLAVTFNEKSKARLNLKFAGNRADELRDIVAEDGADEKTIESLKADFKEELHNARDRLANVEKTEPKGDQPLPTKPQEPREGGDDTNIAALPPRDDNDDDVDRPDGETEDDEYFTAGSGKDDTKLDLSIGKDDDKDKASEEKPAEDKEDGTAAEAEPKESAKDAEKIIREAEELLDEGKYEEAGAKLDELNSLIESE